jgi:hypothetical protein
LAAHLSDLAWDDGQVREPSAITVRAEGTRFNVALNDRDAKASLYVTADTLDEALEALEAALKRPGADWRPWKAGTKRK